MKKFEGKRVCVACSGGADSLCLLHYLYFRAPLDGFELCAVHVEHGLRGEESKADAVFVKKFCDRRGIPLFSFSFDCKQIAAEEKIGIEEAARKARYGAFERLLSEGKTDVIATAHHVSDEAETVLFNLLRGASLTGAGGIKEQRTGFIRPFLYVKKSEILAYAKENALEFREDQTNFIAHATRNKLRLNALPLLESIVSGAEENLAHFAACARRDDEFLYALSAAYVHEDEERGRLCVSAYESGVCGEFDRLGQKDEAGAAKVPESLYTRACVTAMKRMGIFKDYTRSNLNDLLALRELQTGSEVSLPRGVSARREYEKIVFFTKPPEMSETLQNTADKAVEFSCGAHKIGRKTVVIAESEETARAALRNAKNRAECRAARVLMADGEKFYGAELRKRRVGDTFRKFGGGEKSLKKYLTDLKISAKEREVLPVIAKKNSCEVLAVPGVEIAQSVKITEKTKKIVYIALSDGE